MQRRGRHARVNLPADTLPENDDEGVSDDDDEGLADDSSSGQRSGLVTALAMFAAVCLAAAVGLGVALVARAGPSSSSASAVAAPTDESVEAGFARDMQAHHRQAVTMSLSVLNSTDDPEVRQLATDILLTQQQQAGQMHGWLELWGLPQTGSQPVMAWMARAGDGGGGGHDMAGMHGMNAMDGMGSTSGSGAGWSVGVSGVDSMPGMATADQLARLQAARGTDAERLYLQLMIPHHEAGVEMAQAALGLLPARDTAERTLAQSIVASQTSELTVLHALLDARGGPPTS
ncbi:Uncharacterized conserved protein, DUF305 family [Quadrisphaera granulorum]|uniref:Uncharacterized protein (DUF305 family) n=1 Tax=Quadrisphaera granulorum TaxID=317664 RepID=A0A315ZIW6_9ACTN|nr:DUF305 domain-containing protein [Quadrisphaera granulorum]PWJ45153.1 uncharacterized protein (DUF305 family) [Quadrisphaera granulorum]SZE99196.1 Uncharacterized conserved protein, DUF305 family [Quadrisphaera granulorum]